MDHVQLPYLMLFFVYTAKAHGAILKGSITSAAIEFSASIVYLVLSA